MYPRLLKKVISRILLLIAGTSISVASFAQVNVDSCLAIFYDESKPDTVRLYAMSRITASQMIYSYPDSVVQYALELYEAAKKMKSKEYLADAINTQGFVYRLKGDMDNAISMYEQSLELLIQCYDSASLRKFKNTIARTRREMAIMYRNKGDFGKAMELLNDALITFEELNDTDGIIGCYTSMAIMYSSREEYDKALSYLLKSNKLAKETENHFAYNSTLINLGRTYYSIEKYEESQQAFEECLPFFEQIQNGRALAMCYHNIGYIKHLKEEYDDALNYLQKGLELNLAMDAFIDIAHSYDAIAEVYQAQKKYKESIKVLLKARELAESTGDLMALEGNAHRLYFSYKMDGQTNKALETIEKYLVYHDSVMSEESQAEIIRQEEKYKYDKQSLVDSLEQAERDHALELARQEEVRATNRMKNYALFGGVVLLLVAGGTYSRLRYTRRAKKEIEKERDRSDELLLNILPFEIAEELKLKGQAEARHVDDVSILFTDFEEFTSIADRLTPEELVDEINACFMAFDLIMEKHSLEKIKTIGDAYMAAGGLPTPTPFSVGNCVRAALEMQEFIDQRMQERKQSDRVYFEMRLGIHTGPVVAGIVGVKKIQYDVWGDTVNTASRMEGASETGKVNISQSTYDQIKDDSSFHFENRGEIEIKGKGMVNMYYVSKSA